MGRMFGRENQKRLAVSLRRAATGSSNARAQGDAARDLRNWAEAEVYYRRYLADVPEDAAIWVQLGHALKENGNLGEADTAYRTALDLTPDDADLHLQIGHLMKSMGRMSEARQSYAASARLAPTADALAELSSLERDYKGQRGPHDVMDRVPARVYLPISDLLYYLHHHLTVSGIQRVQVNIIDYILNLRDDAQSRFRFAYSGLHSKDLRAIESQRIRELVDYVRDAGTEHGVIRRMIEAAKAASMPVHLRPEDTCFILGSFWDVGGNPELLREIKRSKATLGIYFYDLIPVTHREYVVHELSVGFSQALIEALSFIDFGLAISDYTSGEVKRLIADSGLRPIPITTVPLAHLFKEASASDEMLADEWPDSVEVLRGEKFVLCVCTIEARKNHRYLFDAWKALIAEGIEVPILVLVGRRGWRVDDLMAQLEATLYLDGRVRIVHDLADDALIRLYQNCLFTVFPSIVEGWGLPIGESLSYGKVCVASNTTSMPEVGGDLVEYIDPWNLRSGIDVFRKLITKPDELQRREAAIRAGFRPRRWADVGAALVDEIGHLGAPPSQMPEMFRPLLVSGTLFRPAHFALMSKHRFSSGTERQQNLILVEGWQPAEDFGSWMKGRMAKLSFRSDVAAGVGITLYLHLALLPAESRNTLTLACGDDPPIVVVLSNRETRVTIRVETFTDAAGGIDLTLRLDGPIATLENDSRELRVGLSSLGYAARTDIVSRAELLEALLIDTQLERA